jgi:hypothetical protein
MLFIVLMSLSSIIHHSSLSLKWKETFFKKKKKKKKKKHNTKKPQKQTNHTQMMYQLF